MAAGVTPGNILASIPRASCTATGGTEDILQAQFKEKWDICLKTNEAEDQRRYRRRHATVPTC